MSKRYCCYHHLKKLTVLLLLVVGISDKYVSIAQAEIPENEWQCPHDTSHLPNGNPGYNQYLDNRYLPRSKFRKFVEKCGNENGQLWYDQLHTQYGNSGWMLNCSKNMLYSFWDYRYLDSSGCGHKEFALCMRERDCDGTYQTCPDGYMSAPEFYQHRCEIPCKLYETLTGRSCESILLQASGTIGDDLDKFKDYKLSFDASGKAALKLLREKVDTANQKLRDFLQAYGDGDDFQISFPTGQNIPNVRKDITTAQNKVKAVAAPSSLELTLYQMRRDSAETLYNNYVSLYNNANNPNYYEQRRQYTFKWSDYAYTCDWGKSVSECQNEISDRLTQSTATFWKWYHLNRSGNYNDYHYESSDYCTVTYGEYSHICWSNCATCRNTVNSNLTGATNNYRQWYFLNEHNSNYTYDYYYYYHYGNVSYTCPQATAHSTCRENIAQLRDAAKQDYEEKKALYEGARNFDNNKADVVYALTQASNALTDYELSTTATKGNWLDGFCTNINSNTRNCIVARLMTRCLNRANSYFTSSTPPDYATNGVVTANRESHTCNHGHNNTLNPSTCEKFACYLERQECSDYNPLYVEKGESCVVGNSLGSIYVPELGRSCTQCGAGNTCQEASTYGWYYDSQREKQEGVGTDSQQKTRWKLFFYNESVDAGRWWSVRTSCAPGQTPTYRAFGDERCIVGCSQSCSEIPDPDTGGMMEDDKDTNSCARRGWNPRYKQVTDAYGNRLQCVGGCIEPCRDNGLFTLAETGCDIYTDSAFLTANTQTITRHYGGSVTCYKDRCKKSPGPIDNGNECENQGYRAQCDSASASSCHWTCSTNEQLIAPEEVIDKDGNTIYCTPGCQVISDPPDLQLIATPSASTPILQLSVLLLVKMIAVQFSMIFIKTRVKFCM